MVNSREVCWLKRYFNVFHVIFDLCWNQPFVSLLRLHPNLDGFCQLPGLRFPSWKHQEQWHLPERSPHRTQTQSLAMLLGYSNPMKLLAFPTKKWNSTKSCPCKAEFRTQNLELSYLYSVCLISLLFFADALCCFRKLIPYQALSQSFCQKLGCRPAHLVAANLWRISNVAPVCLVMITPVPSSKTSCVMDCANPLLITGRTT